MRDKNIQLRQIIITGLMTTLVFLATSVIKIPTTNGYIHLGDGFVFMSAILLGPFYGAFAAGAGSMLADILGGYAQWALPTFLIKSLMAFLMGIVIRHQTKKEVYIASGTALCIWTVFFAIIKSALSKAANFSVEKLAESLEDTPENIMQLASRIQWRLSAAIVVFIILVFFLMLWLVKKQKATRFGPQTIIGMMSAGACMVIGYYIAETILYGNPIAPVFSVPMNLIQFVVGIVIAVTIAPALVKLIGAVDEQNTKQQERE
jgi:uncharacterized membrane protein